MLSRPTLPEEILIRIFNYLEDQRDFMNVSLSSRQFNAIASARYQLPSVKSHFQTLRPELSGFISQFYEAVTLLLARYLPYKYLDLSETHQQLLHQKFYNKARSPYEITLARHATRQVCSTDVLKQVLIEPIFAALKPNNLDVYPFVFNHILANLLVNLFPRDPKIMSYAKRWLVKQFPVLLLIDTCGRAHFSSLNFSGMDLSRKNFQDADLTGANLQGAEISGCNFDFANLTRAAFSIQPERKLDIPPSFTGAQIEKAYQPWLEASVGRNNPVINTIQWVETPGFCLAPKPRSFTDLELTGKPF